MVAGQPTSKAYISQLMRQFLITLFLSFYSLVVLADFNFDAYQPITFSNLKARHADELLNASQKSDYVVSTATFKYQLRVTFSKQLRKLSNKNKQVITAWQQSLRVDPDFIARYQQEFKVVFGKHTYWVPVQEDLLPDMGTELHEGDTFELYVIVIGAINNKLVLLTTEFKSDRAPL